MDFLKKNKFILLTLLIVLIFRLPSLFEPYWYGDEGIYLTLGLALKKGLLLYRDAFDNKPPMIYLLAAAAGGVQFWFRFFLLGSVLTTIFFFHKLARKMIPGNSKLAAAATIIFAILTTARRLEGNIANAELFILLPTVIGFYLALSFHKKYHYWQSFLTGFILGIGLLFKAPALFDFAALAVFLLFFQEKKFISLGRREIILFVGYFLPLALTSLFFWTKGIFNLFFQTCFVQTVGYLSSWKTGTHAFSLIGLLKTDLAIKGIILAVVCLFIWFFRKKLGNYFLLAALWFVFALFGATLSGRPYPHYLIQIVPPFCLIIILIFSQKNRFKYIFTILLLGLLGLSYIRYRFWGYPTFSYYQNFIQYVVGQKNKDQYFSYFDKKTPLIYSLAKTIDESTFPEDKIFIWADEPSLYVLSQRLPATPYTVAYHILDLHKEQEVISKLSKEKPKLIIVDRKIKKFPQLELIINGYYMILENQENFTVYLKRNI